jgi:malate dehydrogenase (quinone)
MDSGAAESSNPWNNAGTGHAGLCELNYTPQAADGTIDIKKAVHINTQFEVSKQFWSYLTKKGTFGSCKSFISPVPHLSFVQGERACRSSRTLQGAEQAPRLRQHGIHRRQG